MSQVTTSLWSSINHPRRLVQRSDELSKDLPCAFLTDGSLLIRQKQAPIHHRQHQTATLVSDKDDGQTAGYDLPPPSKDGVVAARSSSPSGANGRPGTAPGENDVYEKTGWAPRFGMPTSDEDGATLLDHQTWLEGKLDDKFFGDWYHNTGIIIFACLSSWVVAVLGGGLASIFIVMAVCGTYYRTSIRRVRRNFRDDVHREMAKAKLETDTESLEWMNSFLVKFWPIFAPVLCDTIINAVDQDLSPSNLAAAEADFKEILQLNVVPAADQKFIRNQIVLLGPRINEAKEKEMAEMMGKLKEVCQSMIPASSH